MTRQARWVAPGTPHPVIVRGIENRGIVEDFVDREAFAPCMDGIAVASGPFLFAWALTPNLAHRLLKSAPAGAPGYGRRLLIGYAMFRGRGRSGDRGPIFSTPPPKRR